MEENNKLPIEPIKEAQNKLVPQTNLLLQFVRQNPLIFVLVVTTITAMIFAPVTVFIIWFRNNAWSSDPQSFAIFGSFFGGVTGVIVNIVNIGILGYIAIHLEQIRLNQEEDKRNEEKILRETKDTHEEKLRLFAIVREWNSEEIYSCRQKAGKLIRENPSKTLKQLHDDFDVDYTCLAVVMGFFTNLNMCIDREIITVKNVIDEFGRIFVWWDEVAVEGKFPKDGWGENNEWKKLKKLIKDNTPEAQLEQWEKYGKSALQEYAENFQNSQHKALHDKFS